MLALMALATGCALGRPIPEVVSIEVRDGATGAGDYTVWVDCVVRNRGPGSGEVRIVAVVKSNGDFLTKEEAVYLSGRTEELKQRDLTFAFPEAEPHPAGLGGFDYSCGSEPTGTPFPDVPEST